MCVCGSVSVRLRLFAKVEYKIQVVRYKLEQQLFGYDDDSCLSVTSEEYSPFNS